MNKNIFIGTTIFSILIIAVSGILLFKKDVGSFSIFNSLENSCTPYNVFVSKGEADYSLEISWYTKGECLGFVQYGTDDDSLEMIAVDLSDKSKSREHRVILEKLLTTEPYYYLINSGGQAYGNNNIPLEFVLGEL